MTDASELLASVGLPFGGSVTWGTRVPAAGPGVYAVSRRTRLPRPPIDDARLDAWIARCPAMTVDGQVAATDSLRARLAEFWIPSTTVVYVGLAGSSIATRIGQFYRTPLGARAPHAGGHWLKTLTDLDSFEVAWAETSEPSLYEDRLLEAFARSVASDAASRLPPGPILPFANLETARKVRKVHGLSGSRDARSARGQAGASRAPSTRSGRSAPRSTGPRTAEVNLALQEYACAHPDRRVTAVDGAAELDRLGILRDSATRRGKPLRDLLRQGDIDHAYQENGRWWFIPCAGDLSSPGK